jgi:hypothetical protein
MTKITNDAITKGYWEEKSNEICGGRETTSCDDNLVKMGNERKVGTSTGGRLSNFEFLN